MEEDSFNLFILFMTSFAFISVQLVMHFFSEPPTQHVPQRFGNRKVCVRFVLLSLVSSLPVQQRPLYPSHVTTVSPLSTGPQSLPFYQLYIPLRYYPPYIRPPHLPLRLHLPLTTPSPDTVHPYPTTTASLPSLHPPPRPHPTHLIPSPPATLAPAPPPPVPFPPSIHLTPQLPLPLPTLTRPTHPYIRESNVSF